jgi:hypothetical protein
VGPVGGAQRQKSKNKLTSMIPGSGGSKETKLPSIELRMVVWQRDCWFSVVELHLL